MLQFQSHVLSQPRLFAVTEIFDLIPSIAVPDHRCYGHGDGFIARKLEAAGFDWFGVSNIEEGMSLRTEGITKPILILGYTPVDCANILAEQKITQALIGMEYCKALQEAAAKAGVVVDGHIKLDTGMTRVGFQTDDENFEESLKEIIEVSKMPNIHITGILHLTAAPPRYPNAFLALSQKLCHTSNHSSR